MWKLTRTTSAVTQELTLAVAMNQELAEVLEPTQVPVLAVAPTQELMLAVAMNQELAEVLEPTQVPVLAIQTQDAYPKCLHHANHYIITNHNMKVFTMRLISFYKNSKSLL